MIRPPVLTGLFWSSISCLSNWVSKTNDASTQKEIFLTQEVSNIFFLSPLVSKKGGEGRIVVAVHTCVTQSTSISPPPYGRQGTILFWVVTLHLIFGPIIKYFFFSTHAVKVKKWSSAYEWGAAWKGRDLIFFRVRSRTAYFFLETLVSCATTLRKSSASFTPRLTLVQSSTQKREQGRNISDYRWEERSGKSEIRTEWFVYPFHPPHWYDRAWPIFLCWPNRRVLRRREITRNAA